MNNFFRQFCLVVLFVSALASSNAQLAQAKVQQGHSSRVQTPAIRKAALTSNRLYEIREIVDSAGYQGWELKLEAHRKGIRQPEVLACNARIEKCLGHLQSLYAGSAIPATTSENFRLYWEILAIRTEAAMESVQCIKALSASTSKCTKYRGYIESEAKHIVRTLYEIDNIRYKLEEMMPPGK